MKAFTSIRLILGLIIAIFIFASAVRASLEEVLAPLPVMPIADSMEDASQAQHSPPSRADRAQTQSDESFIGIQPADIHLSLAQELEARLRPSGNLTIVPLRDFPDLSAYAQPFSVKIMDMPPRLTRSNSLLRFQVENDSGVLGEWSVPVRMHLYSEVWYPIKSLRRGELATPSDFEVAEVDLLVEPDAVPANLEALIRHEYSRDLTPGRPLVWKDLTQRSLVRKGDLVEVSAVQGLLAISMRAVARQDGRDGDVILLRNLDSAKEFSARVTGENRAEVIF